MREKILENPNPVEALKQLIKDVKGEKEGQEIIDYSERHKDEATLLSTKKPKIRKEQGPSINIEKFKQMYGKDAERRARNYKDDDKQEDLE